MLARLYEPVLGRFSSRDPLLGEPTDPLTLNQYVYGLSSPVTYDDPTGLCADPDICPPQVGPGTTQTHSHEFVRQIDEAGHKWNAAQRWVPPPPQPPVPGALAQYTNRLPRLARMNAQATATYSAYHSPDSNLSGAEVIGGTAYVLSGCVAGGVALGEIGALLGPLGAGIGAAVGCFVGGAAAGGEVENYRQGKS
jgi:hypothetical protein